LHILRRALYNDDNVGTEDVVILDEEDGDGDEVGVRWVDDDEKWEREADNSIMI
jgi:hypothetical protein